MGYTVKDAKADVGGTLYTYSVNGTGVDRTYIIVKLDVFAVYVESDNIVYHVKYAGRDEWYSGGEVSHDEVFVSLGEVRDAVHFVLDEDYKHACDQWSKFYQESLQSIGVQIVSFSNLEEVL